MTNYENVNTIRMNNQDYELNGLNAESVLAALNIDTSKVNIEVDGDTLHITERTGTKGADYSGVSTIRMNNQDYELNGLNAESVLAALNIDTSKVNIEVDGDTLHITERTGTKGADLSWFVDTLLNDKNALDALAKELGIELKEADPDKSVIEQIADKHGYSFFTSPDSSFIKGAVYDSNCSILVVEMENGNFYAYSRVPDETFNQFVLDSSKGSFFNGNIVNKFPYEKVEGEDILDSGIQEVVNSQQAGQMDELQANLESFLASVRRSQEQAQPVQPAQDEPASAVEALARKLETLLSARNSL